MVLNLHRRLYRVLCARNSGLHGRASGVALTSDCVRQKGASFGRGSSRFLGGWLSCCESDYMEFLLFGDKRTLQDWHVVRKARFNTVDRHRISIG